jgi:hypothetical protein
VVIAYSVELGIITVSLCGNWLLTRRYGHNDFDNIAMMMLGEPLAAFPGGYLKITAPAAACPASQVLELLARLRGRAVRAARGDLSPSTFTVKT